VKEHTNKTKGRGKAMKDGMEGKYCIVRTQSAGVFAGVIEQRDGQEVIIRDARRLWYWKGAASLSQLAMRGTNNPKACEFPQTVDRLLVLQAIEILECTDAGRASIEGVPVWTA